MGNEIIADIRTSTGAGHVGSQCRGALTTLLTAVATQTRRLMLQMMSGRRTAAAHTADVDRVVPIFTGQNRFIAADDRRH